MESTMKKRQNTRRLDAYTLFPDLMQKIVTRVRPKQKSETVGTVAENTDKRLAKTPKSGVLPPPPPDVSWLKNGLYDDQKHSFDIPTTLVLMTDRATMDFVSLTFEKLGYLVDFSETPHDAIHKLTSVHYAVVIIDAKFEEGLALEESTVHNFISRLPMDRRRLMFYILVGAELRTLYNLEALSLSANLVINNADIEHLAKVFRKSFNDYSMLITPLLESLNTNRML